MYLYGSFPFFNSYHVQQGLVSSVCVITPVLYSSRIPARRNARRSFWSSFGFDIVPLCPFFWFFVCLSAAFSRSHPTLPRSAESRPRFHWRVSTFTLSRRRLVGSPHKERAANDRTPHINLGQCPRPFYLHRDRASQSGISTGEDFDPSTQWLWEV